MNAKILRKKDVENLDFLAHTKKLIAKDAMVNCTILDEDDSIEVVVEKLKPESVNFCVIVDKNKKFIGSITASEIIKIIAKSSLNEPLTQVLNIGYNRDIMYTNASDYVKKKNSNVVNITTSINDVLKIINSKNYDFLVVLDDEKKVLGVITNSSLLTLLENY
jgi:predicted transcriptional regulator